MISVGWQENPDLEKIVELEPDLILMTGERKDLYEDLSEIVNEIRYYTYGHLGYLYDTYKFNRVKPIIQMICSNLKTHLSGVSLKLFKIIRLSMQII